MRGLEAQDAPPPLAAVAAPRWGLGRTSADMQRLRTMRWVALMGDKREVHTGPFGASWTATTAQLWAKHPK